MTRLPIVNVSNNEPKTEIKTILYSGAQRDDPETALITIYSDGGCVVQGGLLFSQQPFAIERRDYPSPHDYKTWIKNNYIVGNSPKWYQLGAWWRLIKLIKERCPSY